MSGVSIGASGGSWTSEAINTRITHEADGVHFHGLIAGVFKRSDDATGYASISFRGVRKLDKVACVSQSTYDYVVPPLVKDADTLIYRIFDGKP